MKILKALRLTWRNTAVKFFVCLFVATGVALIFGRHSTEIISNHWDAWIGVLAAIAVVPLDQFAEAYSKFKRFQRLEGTYNCYSYAEDSPEDAQRALGVSDQKLKQMLAKSPDTTFPNGSTAIVEYAGEGALTITLSENNAPQNAWVGRCIMESEEVGIMAWSYKKLGDKKDPWERNGIKRLAVVGTGKKPRLCIFSVEDGRFTRELLT